MGLYASVVLVIGKFVREFFSGISHSIMFEELPSVDRILKLCMDIFLVPPTRTHLQNHQNRPAAAAGWDQSDAPLSLALFSYR